MSTCPSNIDLTKWCNTTGQNDPSVLVGQTKVFPDQGAVAGERAMDMFSCPPGQEWEKVGPVDVGAYYFSADYTTRGQTCQVPPSCHIVPGTAVVGTEWRGLAWGGRKLQCRKVAYRGDSQQCCVQQPSSNSVDNNYSTCHPDSKDYSKQYCVQPMTNYCSQGNKIVSDAKCKQWAQQQPQAAATILQNYCGQGNNLIDQDQCKTWCSLNQPLCDPILNRVCGQSSNSTRTECQCIAASNEYSKQSLPSYMQAIYIDQRCKSAGIMLTQQLQNQRNQPMNITNCNLDVGQIQFLQSKVGGNFLLQNNCSTNSQQGDSNNGAVNNSTTQPESPASSGVTGWNQKNLILAAGAAAGGVFLVGALGLAVMSMFDSGNNSGSGSSVGSEAKKLSDRLKEQFIDNK